MLLGNLLFKTKVDRSCGREYQILWTRETLTSKYYLSDWDERWTNWLYTVYVMHLSSSISRLLFLNLASGIFAQGREENYYIRTVFKSDRNWWKLEEISLGNGKPFTVRFRSYFIKSLTSRATVIIGDLDHPSPSRTIDF